MMDCKETQKGSNLLLYPFNLFKFSFQSPFFAVLQLNFNLSKSFSFFDSSTLNWFFMYTDREASEEKVESKAKGHGVNYCNVVLSIMNYSFLNNYLIVQILSFHSWFSRLGTSYPCITLYFWHLFITLSTFTNFNTQNCSEVAHLPSRRWLHDHQLVWASANYDPCFLFFSAFITSFLTFSLDHYKKKR